MIYGIIWKKKLVYILKKRVIYETSIVYLFQGNLCAL